MYAENSERVSKRRRLTQHGVNQKGSKLRTGLDVSKFHSDTDPTRSRADVDLTRPSADVDAFKSRANLDPTRSRADVDPIRSRADVVPIRSRADVDINTSSHRKKQAGTAKRFTGSSDNACGFEGTLSQVQSHEVLAVQDKNGDVWDRVPSKKRPGEFSFKNQNTGERRRNPPPSKSNQVRSTLGQAHSTSGQTRSKLDSSTLQSSTTPNLPTPSPKKKVRFE